MADIELTVKQAARRLQTSATTIRRWVRQGKLVARRADRGRRGRPRGTWLIDANSVLQMAAEHKALAEFWGQIVRLTPWRRGFEEFEGQIASEEQEDLRQAIALIRGKTI